MNSDAVIFNKPGNVAVRQLSLCAAAEADVVVETVFSGISTGTEKMLFRGTMPTFPGMGYPLVPGYESVGRIVQAGSASGHEVGETVFVPGANCFSEAAGLFGATASRLVVQGSRVFDVGAADEEDAVLLALAATALHAVRRAHGPVGLVVGHGVLGRLIARIIMALDFAAPVVWEIAAERRNNNCGYPVIDPRDDRDGRYGAAIDASGDVSVIDRVVPRLHRQGELVLAGFYGERIGYSFTPAFMRELTLSIAAEFRPEDVLDVIALVKTGRLSLKGLVTHRASPADVPSAYRTAFNDLDCLKMIIDWRNAA